MFIKLTYVNGDIGFVNTDLIESFGTITNKNFAGDLEGFIGMTYLVTAGLSEGERTYVVKESPNDIYAQIKNKSKVGMK